MNQCGNLQICYLPRAFGYQADTNRVITVPVYGLAPIKKSIVNAAISGLVKATAVKDYTMIHDPLFPDSLTCHIKEVTRPRPVAHVGYNDSLVHLSTILTDAI